MAMTNERALKRALAAVERTLSRVEGPPGTQPIVDTLVGAVRDSLRAEFAPNRRGAKCL